MTEQTMIPLSKVTELLETRIQLFHEGQKRHHDDAALASDVNQAHSSIVTALQYNAIERELKGILYQLLKD